MHEARIVEEERAQGLRPYVNAYLFGWLNIHASQSKAAECERQFAAMMDFVF